MRRYMLLKTQMCVWRLSFRPLEISSELRLEGKAEFYPICLKVAFFQEGVKAITAAHKKSGSTMVRSFRDFPQPSQKGCVGLSFIVRGATKLLRGYIQKPLTN
jgi:hypothetical protein